MNNKKKYTIKVCEECNTECETFDCLFEKPYKIDINTGEIIYRNEVLEASLCCKANFYFKEIEE